MSVFQCSKPARMPCLNIPIKVINGMEERNPKSDSDIIQLFKSELKYLPV